MLRFEVRERTQMTARATSAEYVVSMERANTHYFDVSLRFRVRSSHERNVKLTMPVWTPGHYLIDDFPKNIPEVRAKSKREGGEWEEAKVSKESKNVWDLEFRAHPESVVVDYSVYAFEYHDTKSYLDTVHAIINGASVYVRPTDMEEGAIRVRLKPYGGWKKVATGLEKVSEWEFEAENWDSLIDSPIEVGNQEVRKFRVQGVEHIVSLFGSAPIERGQLLSDLKKIVECEVPIFGEIPYKKYVFIVDFTDEVSGGLEHMNSTVCFVQRMRLIPREEYNYAMSLFSHEFFHAWNVKRLRPEGLGPFNYASETYTRSLWVSEGITSYYDDLILRRAGIYTIPEYLDAFAVNVNLMKATPGARVQSAEEASFDAWIKYYKGNTDAPNVTMSYYTQGAVAGWMLDLQIRRNTRGKRSLDNVMRRIYEETFVKERRGFSEEEFEAVAVDVGGRDIREIFNSRVRGRKDVDFDRYLRYAGLKLEPKDDSKREKGFLGVRLGSEGGKTIVKSRIAGSPAETMGLSVYDEVIGADGLRLGGDKLPFYISNAKPGTSVDLLVARNGLLTRLSGKLGRKPPFEFRIVPRKTASEADRALFRGWLCGDWLPDFEYHDFARSPDRRPLLDFI